MKWRQRTVDEIADMVCGNYDRGVSLFPYRSSSAITRFFPDVDTDYCHDGSTRGAWVSSVLAEILEEPHADAKTPPDTFIRLIRRPMDRSEALNEGQEREGALESP